MNFFSFQDRNSQSAVFTAVVMSSLLAGCDTEEALKKQNEETVRRETTMLQELKAYLAKQSTTPTADTVSIFVSAGLVNSLLKGLEGGDVQIPESEGATLHFNRVKAEFRTGFPALKIDATVSRSGVEVAVSLAARLDAFLNGDTSDKLGLRVHVDSIVPVVSWSFLNFRVSGLVRDLVQVKVSEALNHPGVLGDISIPLNSNFSFLLPAGSTSQAIQGAMISVSTPAMSINAAARVTQVIYLPDGVHLFGRIEEM